MSYNENNGYRYLPFNSELNSQTVFYTYADISDLFTKCKEHKEQTLKFRTVGILESNGGCFYIKDLNCKSDAPKIRVSMVYVKISLPSTIIPSVVQLFGTLQWEYKPIIYANIIQVLNTATGIRLNETLKGVTNSHLANRFSKNPL